MPPYPPSPLYLAGMADRLAKTNPEQAAAYEKIMMACMITVALGSLLGIAMPILKEFRRHDAELDRREHRHERSR